MAKQVFFFLLTILGENAVRLSYNCSVDARSDTFQESIASRLISVATSQKSTVIVYTDTHEYSATTLSALIGKDNYMTMYNYKEFPAFLGQKMKSLLESATLEDFRYQLNFIVICGEKCTDRVMTQITELDNSIGQRSLLRHFSTWLIISPDPPSYLDITLDNVAYMTTDQSKESRYLWNSSREVYTLLWMQGYREWSRVYPSDLSHDQLYTALFPNTLRGLNGRQIVIATLEWLPYTKRLNVSGTITYVGAGIDAINSLVERFNFSYVFVEPSDNVWGIKLKNGSWTGVLGMIQRAEADVCPSLYGISLRRMEDMDFSYALEALTYSVVYRRPGEEMNSWLYLLTCFSWQVYLCGLASLLWILVLQMYIYKARKCDFISRCFEIGIHAPLRQAILEIPTYSSARVVIVTWCIFCLVITSVYTGNLVAIMAAERDSIPFTSLQELAEQGEYAVGAFKEAYAADLMKNSDDVTYKALYGKILESKVDANSSPEELFSDSLEKLLGESFAMIASNNVETYYRSRTCDIVSMKERFFTFYVGFFYPLHSPINQLFDKQLLLLKDIGQIDRWVQNWSYKPLTCDTNVQVSEFKLDSLKAVLVLCAGGIVVATIVLLVEKLVDTWKKK